MRPPRLQKPSATAVCHSLKARTFPFGMCARKANSADAITIFGKYVMDTHIKDGFYPTSGKNLGREVKVGEGLANIPEVIKRLRDAGYKGNYIIEREISGDQQTKDIIDTIALLRSII